MRTADLPQESTAQRRFRTLTVYLPVALALSSLLLVDTLRADEPAATPVPSFVNDVVPLFTRLGCNQGACHGKNAGQNGFRLSLRGYAPDWDHKNLTREFAGRRISGAQPDDSLLVRKALGQVPHAGGRLIKEGSREHRLLVDWLRGGAPGPQTTEPQLRRLELLPRTRLAVPGDEQQLSLQGEFDDGSVRDLTWLAKFEANDAGMLDVTPAGAVKVVRQGESVVRASFQGQVAIAQFTVPAAGSPEAEARAREHLAQRSNFVDEHVFQKLLALKLDPSDLSSDSEFVRRSSLDAIGRMPTPDEVRAFLADPRSDKRARWVDELLARPDFVDFWAVQLGDLLQNRKERDHDVRGTKGVRAFHEWLREQVARNRPWDELAREVLTAEGSTTDKPAVGYFVVTVGERQAEQSEVVASVAQSFLGTRIGCAQCHNHPLEKYTQDDYYHFAAFFSRLKLQRQDPKKAPTTLVAFDPKQTNPVGVGQPRTGQFMKPQPLDRQSLEVGPAEDPRIKLAAWITDPKNEYFSGSMVNRLWKHFFGTGLVEPVDDLRASNPPSNAELWSALNAEFVSHKFDLKHMIRTLLNSRAYQLSSATRPANEVDTRFFSHYFARRLPAEVLLDALSDATGIPEMFAGYPTGIRACQIPDPSLNNYFLSLFGRSERTTACACERRGEVTLPQLLHLQNGDSLLGKIKSPDGRLTALLKAQPNDTLVVEELFLTCLSRLPTAEDQETIRQALASGDNRDELFRDLFWALLNSKEFTFNR